MMVDYETEDKNDNVDCEKLKTHQSVDHFCLEKHFNDIHYKKQCGLKRYVMKMVYL